MAVAGIDGLVSGIKTGDIVNAMIAADRAATKVLEDRKALIQARLKAVQTFNTKLLSAQVDLSALKSASTFNAHTATSSDESVLTATASSSANPGTTILNVVELARAHQRSSTAQASDTAEVGTGNIYVQLGNGVETTLAITAGNGSLNSIARQINDARLGVTASVINDGSTGSPYKLILQSSSSGTANMIKVRGDGTLSNLFLSRTDDEVDSVTDLGDGSITIQVGDGTETTLNFAGAGNSSLDDIAAAINLAALDVTANVVNDGSGSHIELVSDVDGTGIAISGTDGMDGLFDPYANTLTTANDAVVKMGSGATAITITKSSNTITDIITGVTLNLQDTGTTSVTVGNDTSNVLETVETFITSLNAAISYYKENASYDTQTKTAGALFSESGLRIALNSIVQAFMASDPNLPSGMRDISALGITIDRSTGLFSLDKTTFNAALADDPDGVLDLFTNTGTTTNDLVQFAALTDNTRVDNPFTIDITTAAARAYVGNTGALGATTVITNANKQLDITINGTAYIVTLATGSYTRSELATQVNNAINAAVPNGSKVVVGLDGGGTGLEIHSAAYGSNQSVTVTGGTANADLQFALVGTAGVDVAGTITVNGVTTAGLGTGLVLRGADDTDAEGLRLTVTATAPVSGVVIEARKGLGQLTYESFTAMTDASEGLVPTEEDSLENTIEDMTTAITKEDARLAARREYYLARFRQMEQLIQGFNAQGTIITNFANSLAKANS